MDAVEQADVAPAPLEVVDTGRISYAAGLTLQREAVARVQAARATGGAVGRLILLEHTPPVITISRRPDARAHLLASAELLAREGVEVCETDRGGDITYHGPGQLVAYPILDLNVLGLNLHGYLRFLEGIVIDTCRAFGLDARRDAGATGVWVEDAKVCAIGIRVQRWVTSHGLAFNVTTNLDHFGLIVPCGLAGRPVTSLRRVLGDDGPTLGEVKVRLAERFAAAVAQRLGNAAPLPCPRG